MAAVCWVPGAAVPALTAIVQADWPHARYWQGSLCTKQMRLECAFRVRMRSERAENVSIGWDTPGAV